MNSVAPVAGTFAFRPFEIEAIELMVAGVLTFEQLSVLRSHCGAAECVYTGAGYLVTVSHPNLPLLRSTVSVPAIVGVAGEIWCGFIVFLGDHELTLECHAWGLDEIPDGFRERQVLISSGGA